MRGRSFGQLWTMFTEEEEEEEGTDLLHHTRQDPGWLIRFY